MGCSIEAQPYRPHERRLDSRIISCYFVGYVECSWGYKFYNLTSRFLFEIGNVDFLRKLSLGRKKTKNFVLEEYPVINNDLDFIPIIV